MDTFQPKKEEPYPTDLNIFLVTVQLILQSISFAPNMTEY